MQSKALIGYAMPPAGSQHGALLHGPQCITFVPNQPITTRGRLPLQFLLTASIILGTRRIAVSQLPLQRPMAPTIIGLAVRQSSRADLSRNLSDYAHQIASSISSSCSTNEYCQALTGSIIPTCERLSGAAGCWCGNREAFYNCSTCLTNPTYNPTIPDYVQNVTRSFRDFDDACLVYEQLMLNSATPVMGAPLQTAKASATAHSPQSSTVSAPKERSKLPIGVIIGGVLGTIIGLLIVFFGVRLLGRLIKKSKLKESSRKNYYYKSIQYSSKNDMDGHRASRTMYRDPYQCITPQSAPGDSSHIIGGADTPEHNSPPPYQPPTHQLRGYRPDRKSRAT